RALLLRLRLRDPFVRFSAILHQFRADVAADVDVGDVDRQDFESGPRIQAFLQHGLGNAVRVFQHFGVLPRGTDRGNDALADARDHRILAGTADQALNVGANGYARLDLDLDSIL